MACIDTIVTGVAPHMFVAGETGRPHAFRQSVPGGVAHRPAAGAILLTALLLVSLFAACALALAVPRLTGRINDNAHMLSPETIQGLDAKLAAFEKSDSTQVVVLTIPSLEGESLEEYSIKVAQAWGIGQKGKDNGVLLLVAKAERKVRIEVGYGLEGRLTDALSGRITRNVIVPAFKRGDFNAGIADGVSAIMEAVRGEYHQEDTPPASTDDDALGGLFALLIMALFLSPVLPRRWWVRGAIVGALLPGAGLLFDLAGLPLVWLALGGFAVGAGTGWLSSLRSGGGGGGFFTGGSGGSGFGGSSGGSSGDSFSGGGGSFGGGGSSDNW